jgi:hypothetical protein
MEQQEREQMMPSNMDLVASGGLVMRASPLSPSSFSHVSSEYDWLELT